MLEHVSSCRLQAITNPARLLLGAVLAIGGLLVALSGQQQMMIVGGLVALLGVLLVICYFTSRRNEIIVASPSLTIHIKVTKKSIDDCAQVIDELEAAINDRFKQSQSHVVASSSRIAM